MHGGGQIEVGQALLKAARNLAGLSRLSIEGKDRGPVEAGSISVGKQREALVNLLETFGLLPIQVERPGQAALQPGRKRIDANGRAQHFGGLAEAIAAEREQGARARGPGIVRQMGAEGEGQQGRGRLRSKWKLTQPSAGSRAWALWGRSGIDSAMRCTISAEASGDMKPYKAWATHRFARSTLAKISVGSSSMACNSRCSPSCIRWRCSVCHS